MTRKRQRAEAVSLFWWKQGGDRANKMGGLVRERRRWLFHASKEFQGSACDHGSVEVEWKIAGAQVGRDP